MTNRNLFRTLFASVLLALLSLTPVAAQNSDRIVIEFWHRNFLLDYFNAEVEPEFEAAYPQYDLVSRVFDTYRQTWDNYILAQEQGNAPAAMMGTETLTQVLRDSGYFKPVWEAIGDREEVNGLSLNLEDILPVVAAYYQVDGQYFSYPFNTSTAVLYANMDVLVAAGVVADVDDIASLPGTWAELEAACEAIVATTEARCAQSWVDPWFVEHTLAQTGTMLTDNDNGRSGPATQVILDSEPVVELFTWWLSMLERGYFVDYGSSPSGSAAPTADLAAGAVAFNFGSSGGIRSLTTALAENGYSLGVGFLPHNQDRDYFSVTLGGATLYLTDGLSPEVEDGALTFMAFLNTPENAAKFHQAFGYVPIRQSALPLLEADWAADPNFRVPFDQFNAGTVTPAIGALLPTYLEMRDILLPAMQEILLNGASIEETLANASADASIILEEYNLLLGE